MRSTVFLVFAVINITSGFDNETIPNQNSSLSISLMIPLPCNSTLNYTNCNFTALPEATEDEDVKKSEKPDDIFRLFGMPPLLWMPPMVLLLISLVGIGIVGLFDLSENSPLITSFEISLILVFSRNKFRGRTEIGKTSIDFRLISTKGH